MKDLRSRMYRRMLLQETGWYDTKGTGELLNRLVNDTYMIGNSLSQNLSDGLRSTVMIIAGTSMMVHTNMLVNIIEIIHFILFKYIDIYITQSGPSEHMCCTMRRWYGYCIWTLCSQHYT